MRYPIWLSIFLVVATLLIGTSAFAQAVSLEVLNVPNANGDLVLISGDDVEGRPAKSCLDKWVRLVEVQAI